MLMFKLRQVALFAAAIAIIVPSILRAQDASSTAKDAQSLIAVLHSDATTFDKATACRKLAALGDKEAVPAVAALLDDEKLSCYARWALEATADPGAGAVLRDALGRLHGKRLAGVVNSLGVRRDAAAARALGKLARDRASGVADEALEALGRIATPEALVILTCELAGPAQSRNAAACACLNAAARLAGRGNREAAVALCENVRHADVPRASRVAATYGAIVYAGSAGVSLLPAMIKSADKALFAAALRASYRLPGTETTKALLAALDGPPAPRRAMVLAALGNRGDKAALPAVLKAAASGEGEVRQAAISALAQLGDVSVVPVLLDAAADADQGVAEAAASSLVMLRDGSLDAALIARVDQGNPKARAVVLSVLGQRGVAAALPVVLKAADDPADELRLAALRAAGEIASLDALPLLTGRLAAAKTPQEATAVQAAISAACARIGDRDACAAKLQAGLHESPLAVQRFLLDLFGRLGGAQALAIVSAAARDAKVEVRDAATQALGNWPTADAAPVLLDLAKTLRDERLRLRALRGYLRIPRQLDVPNYQRLAMCREALPLAQRDEDKRLIGEVAARVLRKRPSESQAAAAKAILKQVTAKAKPLFDGRTFNGWEGDTKKTFRIEQGAVVGGSLKKPVPHNDFLCTKASYKNFVLRVECKLLGPANGGIQIRSRRVPNNFEVSGYQADMSSEPGGGFWGCLYDESRRGRILAKPNPAVIQKVLKPHEWNQYEIRCEGKRIRLWLNGAQTVDFTETEAGMWPEGIIGLQIHGGPPSEAWYRNVTIEELP
jgi:HEAT repeat protein